jgi:Domain of unknown function (DUF4331)
MSSHREAPELLKDPVADNTDCYAFVSPDKPSTVTIITNYVPLENPPGGPNFFEFGDDVLYSIYIDNDGDAKPDIEYQFRFRNVIKNPDTFLYNTGQITSLTDSDWNRRQLYDVSVVKGKGKPKKLGKDLKSPPCNIGPRSTPNYQTALANPAVHTLGSGEKVFAGQRAEGFFVDLGSIFDLGALRPLNPAHVLPMAATMSVDATATMNVHTIAIQVPIKKLTRDGSAPSNPMSAKSVLGIWGGASRRKSQVRGRKSGKPSHSGPWVQVSRLGMPLFNEVIVPMAEKDEWNALDPVDDKKFAKYVKHPELGKLLPALYPGAFPNLAAYTKKRADLEAILLTGIPSGIVGGFQNYTGKTLADMMRLNVAIPPTTSSPNPLGVVGGDLAGFPNGRRVFDDIVTVELKAVAGATIPLVDPSYTPDGAVSAVDQGITPDPSRYQSTFPYLGTPNDGYSTGT